MVKEQCYYGEGESGHILQELIIVQDYTVAPCTLLFNTVFDMNCLLWYYNYFSSDLPSAHVTENSPDNCHASSLCKKAFHQNLADCDHATEVCQCIRGYKMSGDVCVGKKFKLADC